MFLYHLTRHPTRDLTINTQHPSPSNHQHPSPNTHHPVTINTQHPSPSNHQHPSPNTHHLVTINTQHPSPSNHQHPSPITQHPDGEVFGEVSGGVFAKHLTIQTPQQQRVSGRFGEVFSVCPRKTPKVGRRTCARIVSFKNREEGTLCSASGQKRHFFEYSFRFVWRFGDN